MFFFLCVALTERVHRIRDECDADGLSRFNRGTNC